MGSIKEHAAQKLSAKSLINQATSVFKGSRKEQQQLIKNIKNVVRKHNAKLAVSLFKAGM